MNFPIDLFRGERTPFYYYDLNLLRQTLDCVKASLPGDNYRVHYAMKANANEAVLSAVRQNGLGVDAVSGGEIRAALAAGFDAGKIVFAGVGKSDEEIELALGVGIGNFNVESEPELEVISAIAARMGVVARVALRVNPNIDAHTHHYITTGLAENKFGINLEQLDSVVDRCRELPAVELIGLHFHIGSQITDNTPFAFLCRKNQ